MINYYVYLFSAPESWKRRVERNLKKVFVTNIGKQIIVESWDFSKFITPNLWFIIWTTSWNKKKINTSIISNLKFKENKITTQVFVAFLGDQAFFWNPQSLPEIFGWCSFYKFDPLPKASTFLGSNGLKLLGRLITIKFISKYGSKSHIATAAHLSATFKTKSQMFISKRPVKKRDIYRCHDLKALQISNSCYIIKFNLRCSYF